MQPVQRRVLISGLVQGVFFRASARQEAQRLGLTGWVRNRSDGRVEAVFQGAPGSVQAMVRWCHEGPPGARVTSVEVLDESPDAPFPGFSVRHTG